MPQVVILGFSHNLPAPYSEGHICTLAEADALNKLLVRSLAKGLQRVLTSALAQHGCERKDQASEEQRESINVEARAFIAEFALGFAQGHEAMRAVEVEARRIALNAIEAKLYQQGRKLSDMPRAELEALVADLALGTAVRDEAQRRVNAMQHVARSTHSELSAVFADEEKESA